MLLAFGLHIFVYPKSFALACFDCTIILQKLMHVNASIIEKTIYLIIKDTRNAVEFKIITHNLNEIKHDMIYLLKHVQLVQFDLRWVVGVDKKSL